MLDVLPRATHALRAEDAGPAAMGGPVAGSGRSLEVAETVPARSTQATESSAPASARQAAESAALISEGQMPDSDEPGPAQQKVGTTAGVAVATVTQAELPDPAVLEVPNQTDRTTAFECPIEDSTFCEVLDVTDPYRRANQERDLGLALDALEPDNPLLDGSGLGIDISLPN